MRPDSFVEISNFYTVTIYEKGAEVVRMLLTLLGPDAFRRGTDLYFARHDGQAVTCDDFVACMAEVSGRDLRVFQRWYSQAGTPELKATHTYDPAAQTLTLTLAQHVPLTPGQAHKDPMLLPVKTALLGPQGQRLPLVMNSRPLGTETVLELATAEHRYVFEQVAQDAVPSLLRDYSAPVKLTTDLAEADLLFLLAHDDDAFNRSEAGQVLFLRHLTASVGALQAGGAALLPSDALVAAANTALLAAASGSAAGRYRSGR